MGRRTEGGIKMLKLKIWQIENIVLMKVLEQDESTRNKYKLYKNRDLEIVSAFMPQMYRNIIYVRGSAEEKDDIISVFYAHSIKDAEEYIAKVQRAVHEYNTQQEQKEKNNDDVVKVYIDVKVYIVE